MYIHPVSKAFGLDQGTKEGRYLHLTQMEAPFSHLLIVPIHLQAAYLTYTSRQSATRTVICSLQVYLLSKAYRGASDIYQRSYVIYTGHCDSEANPTKEAPDVRQSPVY